MTRSKKGRKISDKTSDYLNYLEAKHTAEELIKNNKRIGLLIMFGINTGLRYSDLSKLHDRDIEAARANNNELLLIEKKTKKKRIIYLNSLELGWATTGVGFFVLCLYIPLWLYSQREGTKAAEAKRRKTADKKNVLIKV